MAKLELPAEVLGEVKANQSADEMAAEYARVRSQLASAARAAFLVIGMAKERKDPHLTLAAIDRIVAISELRGRLALELGLRVDAYEPVVRRKAAENGGNNSARSSAQNSRGRGGHTSEQEDRREEEQRRQSSKKQRPAPAEAAGYTANRGDKAQESEGGL